MYLETENPSQHSDIVKNLLVQQYICSCYIILKAPIYRHTPYLILGELILDLLNSEFDLWKDCCFSRSPNMLMSLVKA